MKTENEVLTRISERIKNRTPEEIEAHDRFVDMQINKWFTYHPPKGDQSDRYVILREKAKELAFIIQNIVPPCADRSDAIRKLRECIMTANAAIACNE